MPEASCKAIKWLKLPKFQGCYQLPVHVCPTIWTLCLGKVEFEEFNCTYPKVCYCAIGKCSDTPQRVGKDNLRLGNASAGSGVPGHLMRLGLCGSLTQCLVWDWGKGELWLAPVMMICEGKLAGGFDWE